MEIWAYCRTCDRWFYCERENQPTVDTLRCPVCVSSAETVENRATPSGVPERL